VSRNLHLQGIWLDTGDVVVHTHPTASFDDEAFADLLVRRLHLHGIDWVVTEAEYANEDDVAPSCIRILVSADDAARARAILAD
jgi:hypothetical protein